MLTQLFAAIFFLQAAPSAKVADATKAKESLDAAAAVANNDARTILMINPKERIADYIQAFSLLTQERSASKVYFQLTNGIKISNVIEVKPMNGNTLLLFRYNTPQGVKYQVAAIEEISGIFHQ